MKSTIALVLFSSVLLFSTLSGQNTDEIKPSRKYLGAANLYVTGGTSILTHTFSYNLEFLILNYKHIKCGPKFTTGKVYYTYRPTFGVGIEQPPFIPYQRSYESAALCVLSGTQFERPKITFGLYGEVNIGIKNKEFNEDDETRLPYAVIAFRSYVGPLVLRVGLGMPERLHLSIGGCISL